jgi:hypothetical protein
MTDQTRIPQGKPSRPAHPRRQGGAPSLIERAGAPKAGCIFRRPSRRCRRSPSRSRPSLSCVPSLNFSLTPDGPEVTPAPEAKPAPVALDVPLPGPGPFHSLHADFPCARSADPDADRGCGVGYRRAPGHAGLSRHVSRDRPASLARTGTARTRRAGDRASRRISHHQAAVAAGCGRIAGWTRIAAR